DVHLQRGKFGQAALFDPAPVRPDMARRGAQRGDAEPHRRPVHRPHAQRAPRAAVALEPSDATLDVQAPDLTFLSHPASSCLAIAAPVLDAAAASISTAVAPSPR